MDDARVAGMELDAGDVGARRDRNANRENAEGIGFLRRQRKCGVGLDDQVGLPEQPAVRPLRQRRKVLRITFRRSALRPLIDRGDLAIGQQALPDEVRNPRFDLPWRHEARCGDRGDLRGTAPDVVVTGQRERSGTAIAVAGDARLKHDRRDVFRKGLRARREGEKTKRKQEKDLPSHFTSSDRMQPTARVSRGDTLLPATIALNASSRSRFVGAARSFPNSTYRSSMRPRYSSVDPRITATSGVTLTPVCFTSF